MDHISVANQPSGSSIRRTAFYRLRTAGGLAEHVAPVNEYRIVIPLAELQLADALASDNQRTAKFVTRGEQDIRAGHKWEERRSCE